MSDRDALTAAEAEAWAAFEAAIEVVPRDRREEPATADGWSVKDVLWHVAYWWGDGAETYRAMREGTFEDRESTAEETDATNAGVLAEGRAMSLEEVEAGAAEIRDKMLEAWRRAPDRRDADENFVSETVEHYEEHLPALRAFAAEAGSA
jgi:uncharacterized damage-inducible protein DinB